jgi:hypothetical protein
MPILFLFWIYRDGLRCWFIADDFAWLGLLRQINTPADLLRILFEPAAQGTIRPWSERGFFVLFERLFGLDNLPFRLAVFGTMAADLTLIAWITHHIAHSRLAGFVAAIVWTSNAALMTVMTWSAAYNEALCPLFLLSALALFMRYAETEKRKFWWWQLVVFTLGFGVLEINVVYPAIAAAWALFVAPVDKRRRLLRSVIPLAAISILYFALHSIAAPFPKAGPYAIRVDGRMLDALRLYVTWSLLPNDWEAFGHSHRVGLMILSCGIAALIALFVSEARKRRRTILFFLSWYLATLVPVLPLPDHHSDYYLTIPLIGLAMLAGWAVSCAWRNGRRSEMPGNRAWQIAPAVVIIAYLCGMIPVARSASRWALEKTKPVRGLVLGVEAAHRSHPGKAIVLTGITPQLFEDSIGQGAFYPLHIDDVYLAPEAALTLRQKPDLANLDRLILDPAATFHAITSDRIVVYSVAGDHLRNITESWERSALSRLPDQLPSRVDVGNPLYSWLLGPSWLPSESGVRWMPGEARIRLRGPQSPGSHLVIEGNCTEEQLKKASRHLLITADGVLLGETQIDDPETSFNRLFALPDLLVGRKSIEIAIRVSPVEHRGKQEYGLTFGSIAVGP